MTSTTLKTTCVTCRKGVGQFKCEGCSQTFCTKHVDEHRQALNQQLDEVIVEHDTFQKTVMEDKNQCHPLVIIIDHWEQKSIDKIRRTVKEVREKVSQFSDTHRKTITQELQDLKEQIKKARKEDDFFETDLQNWLAILERLKRELTASSLSNNIKEDQTKPLVYQIQIFSLSSGTECMKISDQNNTNRRQMESNTMLSNVRRKYINCNVKN